jgi:hypothetical protein
MAEGVVKRYQGALVSADFRAQVLRELPAFEDDVVIRRFIDTLLFSSKLDSETGGVIISQDIAARIEGKRNHGGYKSMPLLEKIQGILPGLTWGDHVYPSSWSKGRARHVLTTGLSGEIERLAQEEVERFSLPLGLVDFVTGREVIPSRLDAISMEQKKAAAGDVEQWITHEAARDLLVYMNGVPKQPFSRAVERNLGSAYDVARSINSPRRKNLAFRLLRQIAAQPKPLYRPSRRGKTVRIFGSGIVRLPREVRAAMTNGWDWFDLVSSQLAIAAAMWGVSEELAPYLKISGDDDAVSIWDSLFDHMGERAQQIKREEGEDYAAVKGVFKSQLYGVVFGQGKTGLARFETWDERESGGSQRAETVENLLGEKAGVLGKRFLKHEAIKVLLSGRKQAQERIKKDGGIRDVFGVWIPAKTKSDVRSALAQVAQAAEMKLLLPVVELAKSEEKLHITLWLHDGFAVHATSHEKRSRFLEQIERLVEAEAKALGVRTYARAEIAADWAGTGI